MKLKFILIIQFFCSVCFAQSYNRNFVEENVFLDEEGNYVTNLSYYDGLGNLTETVSNSTVFGHNIYTYIKHDCKSREYQAFLPVPFDNDLEYKESQEIISSSNSFYHDGYAYVQNTYDAFDHVVRENMSGEAWHKYDAHKGKKYSVNSSSDHVIKYDCDPLVKSYYPEGCLEKECTKDADGNEVTVFRQLDGNVILERRNQGDTYFVYDKIGKLRYVLSPKYQDSENLAAYAYQYVYDERGNLSRKTLPGAESTQYWYDKDNRLVFEQTAQLRSEGLYRFYLYDSFNRLVVTGTSAICNTEVEKTAITVSYSSTEGFLGTGYTSSSNLSDFISDSESSVDKVYYYDSYSFLSGFHSADYSVISTDCSGNANGRVSGSMVKASNGEMIFCVYGYDPKGNLVLSSTKGLNGLVSIITNTYSLTNKLLSSREEVDVNYGEKFSASLTNEYSKRCDLLTSKSVSLEHGGEIKTSKVNYIYDAVNRLSQIVRPEKVGTVTYEYDVHGWPIKIEMGSFKENLFYADGDGTPCFNGNISSMKWTNANYEGNRCYKFQYDQLNRLSKALYNEEKGSSDALGYFDEYLCYDKNGNIVSLERHGKKQDGSYGVIDELSIELSGNQLSSITDASDKLVYEGAMDFATSTDGISKFKYNSSGSLVEDTGRGITMIEYDHFNNPIRIQFANGNVIKYIYSAEGKKLRSIYYTAMPNIVVRQGEIHDLCSAEVQVCDSVDYLLDGKLILKNSRVSKYLFGEGYAEAFQDFVCIAKPIPPFEIWDDGSSDTSADWKSYEELMKQWRAANEYNANKDEFSFRYYNKDHIGNIREVVDENGEVLQVMNYYPYGTPFCDPSSSFNSEFQPYKYNGKELDLMHGLDTYDYGARQYNSIIATWDKIDPQCESYSYMSPYNYCLDNPVNTTDQDGEGPIIGAVIGGGIELATQMIEKYDSNLSVFDNLSQNVNWTNVGIASAEGALTSGVSAFKSLGAKVAISAVSSAAKEVSNQMKDNNKAMTDLDNASIAKEAVVGGLLTLSAGKIAIDKTKYRFKDVKAVPSSKAIMHRRAGQMRYAKSTRKNARQRLKKEKEKYSDNCENLLNLFLNSFRSFINR